MSINKLVHHMLGNINSISFLLTMVTAAFPNNGALTLGVGALLIWQSLFFLLVGDVMYSNVPGSHWLPDPVMKYGGICKLASDACSWGPGVIDIPALKGYIVAIIGLLMALSMLLTFCFFLFGVFCCPLGHPKLQYNKVSSNVLENEEKEEHGTNPAKREINVASGQ